MNAFLPAAGFGTRMGDLTRSIPKPLLPVGGVPMIYYALFQLWRWKVDRVVVNLHFLKEKIERELSGFKAMEIVFSREDPILGTAGGIRNALPLFSSDAVVVLNPDSIVFTDRSLEQITSAASSSWDSLLGIAPLPQGSANTPLSWKEGQLSFEESGSYYYMGASVLKLSQFDHVASGYSELGSLWRKQAYEGRLEGFLFEGNLLDAGNASEYRSLPEQIVPGHLAASWKEFIKNCK